MTACRELHRMARHGVTAGELRHTVASMLRDSKMDAEQVRRHSEGNPELF